MSSHEGEEPYKALFLQVFSRGMWAGLLAILFNGTKERI